MKRLVRDKRILTVNELTVVTERIKNSINGNGRYQVDIFKGEWYIGTWNMEPYGDPYEYIAEQSEKIFNEREK